MAVNGNTLSNSTVIEQLARTYYQKIAQDRLLQNMVFWPLARHVTMPKNSGSTYVFHRWGNVAGSTTALDEDATTAGQVTSTGITANSASLALASYGQFAKYTNLTSMTARRALEEDLTLVLADAASDTVDLLARAELNSNAGGFIGSGGAKTTASITTADTLSPTIIRQLGAKLGAAKVRPFRDGGKYAAIFHDYQLFDLMSDTTVGGFLATAQYAQPNKIWNGEVGALMGFRLLKSQNIVTTSVTSGVTAYAGFVLGEGALASVNLGDASNAIEIIVNAPGSAGTADPYQNIGTVAYLLRGFGFKYLSGTVLADAGSAHRALKVTTAVSFNG